MPCRPKLCQRLAAQLSHPPSAPAGNNHIWISDELLSEAFNRYVSVSHATRRRGSNVPGPLEARERAAKRRMGMAAAATSIGPAPGGDFGALFGTGAGGNTGENRWAWKPPGNEASSSKPSTKSPSSVWSWASRPSKPPAEWDEYLEMPKLGEDLVERSRAAFEELLKSAKAYGTLDATQVTPLIEFLTSSADEPESKNVSRLVQWLPGLSVSKSAWSAITTLICDKIKLASIDYDELLEVIRALPSALDWKKDDRDRQRLHEICRLFSRSLDARASTGDMAQQAIFDELHKTMHDSQACADLVEIFLRTVGNHTSPGYLSRNISVTLLAIHNHTTQAAVRTELISQLGLTISQFSSDLILDVLRLSTRKILGDSRQSWEHTQPRALTWLECLTQQSVLSNHLPVVYAELARRLRPYHLAEHFGQLHGESVDIARILLRDWLPNTDLEKLPRVDHTTDRAASGLREFKRVQYSLRDLTAADLPAIAQDFEHLYATEPSTPHLTWLVLIRAFARAGVSYEHVLYDVFHICKSRISLQSMYMLFKGLLTHHDLALPTRCFVYLIEHFLAKGRNDLALKTFQDVPSLSITDVPSLPLALLEDAKVDADMWDLLLRHPESLRLEDRYSRLCNALPEHVELAHLMAHRIATTTAGRLTPLQAFRRVWAVYHWLKDRNAPIQPLLSRSFVTAGILRPIQEHLWIPPAKFEYILSIVEEIEGAEVRTSVEQLASHMRGSVHDKVLAKRYLAKQNAWMKQSTDLAAEMRFRYKRWTKHKPVPTSDGQTFVIPSSSPEPATIWHPFARSTREKPASTQDVGLSRAPPREAKRKMVLRPAGMQADTHFRLKRWTKRKPVPAADGQHFKVPSRPLKPTIVPHSLIQSEDGKVYQQPSLAATTSQSSPETLETSELHSLLEIPAIKTERLLSRGQDDNEREGKDRSRAYPFRKRAEDNLAEANIAHDAEKWRIIQKLRMEKLRGRDRSRKWRKIDPGSRETSIRENWPRE